MGRSPEPPQAAAQLLCRRLKRPTIIDMDENVELFSESRLEVVTGAFGIRTVDDPNGPFQPLSTEQGGVAFVPP